MPGFLSWVFLLGVGWLFYPQNMTIIRLEIYRGITMLISTERANYMS
ncbi:hypothetical protein BMS3Bbin04_00656 [bacterium BMS3Bbin04]|nr:hypothetical protein BMS3Bbin04_00656 [bacterium BMS3Bbin04]